MKLLSIFIKNLKMVARNWVYFVVLFIFPLFLIITSAVMLNSNDLKNIRIGIVDESYSYQLDLQDMGRVYSYRSLDQCLFQLTNYRISACVYVWESRDETQIEVYLDNTRRVIELYARQALLERIFQEQTEFLEATSETIDSRLTIYSTMIGETVVELDEVYLELERQEELLIQYRADLASMRQDFDRGYNEAKNVEPDVVNIRRSIENGNIPSSQEINSLRNNLNSARSNLVTSRFFLSGALNIGDFNYVSSLLDDSINSIDEVDSALVQMEEFPTTEILLVLNSFESMMAELDKVKIALDKLDSDLSNAIVQTRNSKVRIDVFKDKLNDLEGDISGFEEISAGDSVSLKFKSAFSIPKDLVVIAFPFVISIIITFSSLVLSNRFILNQVNKPSYLREIMTPSGDANFVFSDYLINMFFVMVQAAILLVIGLAWFGMSFGEVPAFLFSITLASSVLVFAGISIGYLIKSESLSTLFTIFLVMFLLIFSDILVPSMLSGPLIRFMINLNPFVILNNLLRDIILVGKPLYQLILPLFRLSILLASSILIAYLSKKANKEGVIQ